MNVSDRILQLNQTITSLIVLKIFEKSKYLRPNYMEVTRTQASGG